MRWSKAFIPTLRQAPQDAESISHKLLFRAGAIRKLASGIYSYLPLGLKILSKISNIVREEMNRQGAIELLMPAIHPAEIWQETDRFDLVDILFKCKDRSGKLLCLGSTHEEIITDIVRNDVLSYKQLPIILYQIQTKFRDEVRPRFGIIRSKEFIMKDAYSFDVDRDGLNKSYKLMCKAYRRIFERCGIPYSMIEADTGFMGGDASHEFTVPNTSGEDLLIMCTKCKYKANRDKAECTPLGAVNDIPKLPMEKVDTPNLYTVEEIANLLKVSKSTIIKTLIFQTEKEPVAVLIRGDHEVNISKLARALHATSCQMATQETIEKVTGGPLGFSGPVGLTCKIIADYAVKTITNGVTGANEKDKHLKNVNITRDYDVNAFHDLRYATSEDTCPKCGGETKMTTCIELGHTFKLGIKYTEQMKAYALKENGERIPIVMGCYGIGINRILASSVEVHNDENGIIWPYNIAPYHVIITTVNMKDEIIKNTSETIYRMLLKKKIDVLWDDRDLTPGTKFKDADLIGIPLRITVGSKFTNEKIVDIKLRNSSHITQSTLDNLWELVYTNLKSYKKSSLS